MFKSKYLIRLDDASSYSDMEKWKRLEQIFDVHNIKPIIAVIPDNQDKSIQFKPKNDFFWDWIKSLENKDWTIALHGYQHLYHTVPRKKNIFPFYSRSEFTGLDLETQRNKIRKAMQIFSNHKVDPKLWVAPGHCFDDNTLKALSLETNICMVSDGIALKPYFDENFFFIPQQLWSFKKKYSGIWTVCLHPDTMTNQDFEQLAQQVRDFNNTAKITTIQKLTFSKNAPDFFDRCLSFWFWKLYNLKNLFRPVN